MNDTSPTERYESKTLNLSGRLSEFNFILNTMEKFKRPPGKLLDVGCYEGYFLQEAEKRGWEGYGVEPNRGGYLFARDILHLNVKQCVLERAGFESEFFDVVSVLAALEHVPDPHSLLINIRDIMPKEGLLIITVPTIPFYLPLVRSKWRMFIGDHYYFFDDYSMSKILSKARFRLVQPGQYIVKTFDLDTMSSRLADEWQPNNLGRIGKLFPDY